MSANSTFGSATPPPAAIRLYGFTLAKFGDNEAAEKVKMQEVYTSEGTDEHWSLCLQDL